MLMKFPGDIPLMIFNPFSVFYFYTFHAWFGDLCTYANRRVGARGSVVLKALFYKKEGRGFDIQWDDFF
jgi:hypothetical protein